MKIQFDIPDESLSCFSNEAKDECILQAKIITEKLADEAMRIETVMRSNSNVKQVTPDMVDSAAKVFLKQYVKEKNSKKRCIIEIFSLASTSLTSILFSYAFTDLANHQIILIVAIFLSFIAISTSVISILNKI